MAKYSEKRNEVDNHIYEVCESTCHEFSANDEVEYKEKRREKEKLKTLSPEYGTEV